MRENLELGALISTSADTNRLGALDSALSSGLSRFNVDSFLEVGPGESLADRGERLRSDINHGEEYLLRVQGELREQWQLLEQWAQYERTCSLQPLDYLVQSVWLKEGVEKFLRGWLKRRHKELNCVVRKLESSGHKRGKQLPRRRNAAK